MTDTTTTNYLATLAQGFRLRAIELQATIDAATRAADELARIEDALACLAVEPEALDLAHESDVDRMMGDMIRSQRVQGEGRTALDEPRDTAPEGPFGEFAGEA